MCTRRTLCTRCTLSTRFTLLSTHNKSAVYAGLLDGGGVLSEEVGAQPLFHVLMGPVHDLGGPRRVVDTGTVQVVRVEVTVPVKVKVKVKVTLKVRLTLNLQQWQSLPKF